MEITNGPDLNALAAALMELSPDAKTRLIALLLTKQSEGQGA